MSGQKIYIQSSLHADETPAMLTTVLLKRRLLELQKQAALNAEIVLVPVANPVGLGQYVLGQFLGRFDLGSVVHDWQALAASTAQQGGRRNLSRLFCAIPRLRMELSI
jgi:predicted deacylase